MTMATSAYEETRLRHVAHAMGQLGEHLQRLEWPRERILEEQQRGLRSLVAVARKRSPWHAARLRDTETAAFTRGDLASLPVMTKDDLMSNWDAIVTDRRLTLAETERHLASMTGDAYLLEEYHAVASGGSSGRRGVFAWDWDGWAQVYLGFTRWLLRAAMRMDALDQGRTMALVAAEMPTHMTSAVGQTFANQATPVTRFPVTLPMADIVAGLNELRPTVLSGYASILSELVREAREGRLRVAPRLVVATSEPLLPDLRGAIESVWGAPVMNWWGTSEAGATGSSCGFAPGMHLAEDMMIVEPVDDAYRPVAAGEKTTRVLVTNLVNPLLPLIRYEITDEVRLLEEPCPCGSAMARVDDIEGRTDDCFVYEGGVVVHPHVLRSPLARDASVVEYQVRQTARGVDVDVLCGADVDVGRLAREIAEHLRGVGLAGAEARVRRVEALPRTSAGKLRRFVPVR